MKAKTDGDQIQSDLEFLKLERLKLESQNNQNQIPVLQLPDGLMTVGIDGGFIRARGKQGCFEVIAGKSMVAFKRSEEHTSELSHSRRSRMPSSA